MYFFTPEELTGIHVCYSGIVTKFSSLHGISSNTIKPRHPVLLGEHLTPYSTQLLAIESQAVVDLELYKGPVVVMLWLSIEGKKTAPTMVKV